MLHLVFLLFPALAFAGEFTFDQFINPPAEPIAAPTANDIVVFAEGTTQTLQWITRFKTSSLALLPLGADPLVSRDTANFITRNVTIKSVNWPVAPPAGFTPGIFFFQLYQEGGGTGNFGSHTFTIDAVATSTTSTPLPTTTSSSLAIPIASTTFAPSIIVAPSIVIAPSILPNPTTPIASSTPPTTTIPPLASTSSIAVVSPVMATLTPLLSSSSLVVPFIVSTPMISNPSIASTPSISPTSPSSVFPTSSSTPEASSDTTTSALTPSLPNADAQTQMIPTKKLTTPDKVIAIIIPIIIVFTAISGFLLFRIFRRRRGVEAMMKKSMKVQEMSPDTYGNKGRRDSVSTKEAQSMRVWGDGRKFNRDEGLGEGRRVRVEVSN